MAQLAQCLNEAWGEAYHERQAEAVDAETERPSPWVARFGLVHVVVEIGMSRDP
jgi:hypothetical protein